MATQRIPNENNESRQVNEGDVFGELWATFNLDLTSSPGKIKVARHLVPTMSTVSMVNDDVHTIALFDGDIVTFSGSDRKQLLAAERNPRIPGNWISTAGTTFDKVGNDTDSVVFGNLLIVSTNNDLASLNTAGTFDKDWWTNVVSGTITNATSPHTLAVTKSGQETLFVTDGNIVRYYNSTAGHSSFTLNSLHTACALTVSQNRVWAGTYTESGNALVYELAVGETVANNAYEVDGAAVLSMCTHENTPYIVTDRGRIQRFNGVAFVTVASFPFSIKSVNIDGVFPGTVAISNHDRAIHPKGMQVDNHSIFIYVNTKNELIDQLALNPQDEDDIFDNTVVDERSPSGVWEYNLHTGVLNHRNSIPYDTTSRGYHVLAASGPLFLLNNQYSKILLGARTESDRCELLAEDYAEQPLGYFITPELESNSIQHTFEKLVLKANTLQSGETITVKYRTTKNPNYPQYNGITWLDETRFTTTDTTGANISVGDEIEVISGYQAGKMAHVTDVSGSGTYTITIDESLGVLNETSRVRVQNWTKIDDIYDETDGEYKIIGLNVTAPWIQFKVIMDGNIELRRMFLTSDVKNTL